MGPIFAAELHGFQESHVPHKPWPKQRHPSLAVLQYHLLFFRKITWKAGIVIVEYIHLMILTAPKMHHFSFKPRGTSQLPSPPTSAGQHKSIRGTVEARQIFEGQVLWQEPHAQRKQGWEIVWGCVFPLPNESLIQKQIDSLNHKSGDLTTEKCGSDQKKVGQEAIWQTQIELAN